MLDPENVPAYVEITREAMRRMTEQLTTVKRGHVEALETIPDVVEALRHAGLVPDEDVKLAHDALATHSGALTALAELGRRSAALAPAYGENALGDPIERPKRASDDGARGGKVSEADAFFRRKIAEYRAGR